MPIYTEDAAHLLLFLSRAGLMIRPGIDCRTVLLRLAHLLLVRQRDAKGLSHFGAASWILSDLEKAGFVTCDHAARQKILAILGTGIANVEIAHGLAAR